MLIILSFKMIQCKFHILYPLKYRTKTQLQIQILGTKSNLFCSLFLVIYIHM